MTFKEIPGNVIKWTLHLRNMSSSLSGKYECSFILYPEGIQTKIYNLLIQKNGKHNKYVPCANHVLGMILSTQVEQKEVLLVRNTETDHIIPPINGGIATVISDKKCSGLVREHIVELREIGSEKVTSELRSKERVSSNSISEMRGY